MDGEGAIGGADAEEFLKTPELERFMVVGNHLTGMILRRGEACPRARQRRDPGARFAVRYGISDQERNDATAQKNPA